MSNEEVMPSLDAGACKTGPCFGDKAGFIPQLLVQMPVTLEGEPDLLSGRELSLQDLRTSMVKRNVLPTAYVN